jgi:aryl-alcohol dehydrogenase-like predicted oxidoreductase
MSWPPASRLGLGLAALGRPGYITVGHGAALGPAPTPEHLRAHSQAVLQAAWTGGIRYFDAARSYGRAEEFLAGFLAGPGPAASRELTVASKWGYVYTAGWRVDAEQHEVKDHSLANLERQWAETRALLPGLDLYQVHSATPESGVLDDRAVLARLARLKDEGVRVGLSLSGPAQARTLERASGLGLFDAVQATWNLLEPSAGPELQRAHDAGMVVILKEVMANGRLIERLEATGMPARLGLGADALALAAALAQPFADVVLSGAATVEQLEMNLAALAVQAGVLEGGVAGGALSQLAALAELPEVYWTTRSRLPWN